MNFEDYRSALEKADKLAGTGNDSAAAVELRELALADLPPLDRALCWVAAAGAYERCKDATAALAAFDAAVALETPLLRFSAAFKKADYLLRLGRKDESRELFGALRDRPEMTLTERNSVDSRLKLLRRIPAP